jgi:hypothetical protein
MQIRAVVDRFEGEKAVLLVGDDEIPAIWPRQFLPDGIRETAIINIQITVDEAATKAAQEAADDLLKSIVNPKDK